MSDPNAGDCSPGWSALDVERVRAAEDRRRVERLGAVLPDAAPARSAAGRAAQRVLRAVGARAVAGRSSRTDAPGVEPPSDPALRARRIAILVAAPTDKIASRWGDWHLAAALARSLERLGYVALVATREHHDDDAVTSCAVEVVLRGLHPPPPRRGPARVIWIISHPDAVTVSECDEADLVLVASSRFADHLRRLTSTPVEVMLQATDHHRFRPLPPDPARAHDVLAVAKTRDVPRPVVVDALAAGLRPAVYGTGWHGVIDERVIEGSYVANEELPRLYSSAGVVLNDHWEDMRRWGFVSNRLFDVVACAAPVVSDEVPGVDEVFGDAVLQYRTPSELRALVERCLAEPEQARARVVAGRRTVLAAHTFDHRAAFLSERLPRLVQEHRAR